MAHTFPETQEIVKEDLASTLASRDEDEILIFGGDVGLAKFCKKRNQDTIIIYDKRGNGFSWRDHSDQKEPRFLWEEKNHMEMVHVVCHSVIEYVDEIFNILKNRLNTNEEKHDRTTFQYLQNKFKKYKNIRKYVRSHYGCVNILKQCVAQSLFTNKEIFSKMNSISHLFPIANGLVVNLKTLVVRLRTKEDLFSITTNIVFDPFSDFKNAIGYISRISKGDQGLITFFQLFLGYCLSGETSERSAFINYGEGKKSLFEIMSLIMGDFYSPISSQVLIKKSQLACVASQKLMTLLNKRLVYLSETEDGKQLNDHKIKSLITKANVEQKIRARSLFKEEISFKPFYKLCISRNHKPKFNINDTDRIVLIPFLNTFEDTIENKLYVEKVKTEHLNEIASWLILGAHKWFSGERLILPEVTIKEQDSFQQFIDEKCELGSQNFVAVTYFKRVYFLYCRDELQEIPVSKQTLSKRMKKLFGDPKGKRINNKVTKCWYGVKLHSIIDPVAQFIKDRCIRNEDLYVPVKEFRNSFVQYCQELGILKVIPNKVLSQRTKQIIGETIKKRIQKVQKICWNKISLKY